MNNPEMRLNESREVSILIQTSLPEEMCTPRNSAQGELRQIWEYQSNPMMDSRQMLQAQFHEGSILIRIALPEVTCRT
jgi:hypothetical protein